MGLIGGALIGSAGAMYLLVNGRVMGASGILGALVDGSAHDTARERATFLIGLIVAPGVVALMLGGASTHITGNIVIVAAAGILVGLGTRLANGCTSGHGVCGISRLSLRGIVATLIYIAAGAVMVALVRALLGDV